MQPSVISDSRGPVALFWQPGTLLVLSRTCGGNTHTYKMKMSFLKERDEGKTLPETET